MTAAPPAFPPAPPRRAPGRAERLRPLANAIYWDLRIQLRHQIFTVAILVTVAYGVILRLIPEEWRVDITVVLVLSDPTMIGFMFVGALILLERGAGTLNAVSVTPLSTAMYVVAKVVSLTAICVASALVMTVVGHGTSFQALPLIVAVVLTSMLFVLTGIAAVIRVRSLNAYLLVVPVFLVPLYIPLLGVADIGWSVIYHVIPTHASLVLIQRAFEDRPAWELVYAVLFLVASIAAAYVWATRSFDANVRGR